MDVNCCDFCCGPLFDASARRAAESRNRQGPVKVQTVQHVAVHDLKSAQGQHKAM
jgi:hypothetical protein